MKKLCCIPCTETPNVTVSFHCLSACCKSESQNTTQRQKIPKSQATIVDGAKVVKQTTPQTQSYGSKIEIDLL